MRHLELSAPSTPRLSFPAAILIATLALAAGCSQGQQGTSRGQEPGASRPTPPAAGAAAVLGTPWPSPAVAFPRVAAPSLGAAAGPPSAPSPSPTSAFGCPSGPCPSSLEYAVNGCSCAGQTYVDSQVTAQFCCKSGFSDSECPEALQQEALAESTFGATAEEVEAQLVTVTLQGWPLQLHEKAAPAFRQAAAKIDGMSYQVQEPPESYNRRDVGGHEVLSLHSFGIAVDINPSANPSCGITEACRCYNDLVTDMPTEFVQAFKDAGFDWGGDWVEHPDPMHFEWARWR